MLNRSDGGVVKIRILHSLIIYVIRVNNVLYFLYCFGQVNNVCLKILFMEKKWHPALEMKRSGMILFLRKIRFGVHKFYLCYISQ